MALTVPSWEVLHLLQYRVRGAVGEDVARQQQYRQPVHMRQGGSGHEVGGPRPDGCGYRHGAAPDAGPGVGDRGMRHALFVVAPVRRQLVARRIQRLAERRHVAVAENGPDAGDERDTGLYLLRGQVAHQRLGGGQADGFHAVGPHL